MFLAVLAAVVVVVLQEKVLVGAVAGKGDDGDAKAGERVLEAVEAGEAACVAPRLAVHHHHLCQINLDAEGEGRERTGVTHALSHGS